ncbi:MAG: hypothetical protein V2I79_03985 [Xanthomonadales bacterium]|nr:hypothetical protein [Xanthomonadales bacterium]
MTRKVLTLAIALTATIGIALPAQADVLLIEEVRQAGRMTLPTNGMSKDDVRARFGDPVRIHAPVGDPPITRWDYQRWSAYFEYDLVLSSVLVKGEVIDRKTD